ncbi:EAL domain-containing protein [Vibrio brasiliensis]|nr:EAL domain-containing protein [Vibrio brasiliensis]MCG9724742.1 EAL domain-containing protein [Vibrio brasiliensis]
MKQMRVLNLNLQTKTALYFLLGLLGVTLSCLYITRYFFVVSLTGLETLESNRASLQARNVITMMSDKLEDHSYDWAYWDETNDVLLGEDLIGYRERNFHPDSLDALDVDLMMLTSLHGEFVDAVALIEGDSQSLFMQVLDHPQVTKHISRMNSVLDSSRDSLSGLFAIEGEIWTLAITPVRNSDGTSASSGWIIWGQNLSLRFPGDFSEILVAESQIVPLSDSPANHSPETNNHIEKTKQALIQSADLYGVSGQVVAHLTTTIERNYYQKGNILFAYLLGAVAIVTIIISLATYFTFKRRVAVRFSDLEKDIDELFSAYQLEGLDQPNKDELDRLAKLVQTLAINTSAAKEQLHDAEQKFTALYQSRTTAILLIRARVIVDINPTALSLLDYQRDDLIDQPLDKLCPDSDQPECQIDGMYQSFKQGQTQFEAQMLTSSGEEIDCKIEISLIQYQGQPALMLSVVDVREHKQQAKMIEDLVERDHLSGLWNRKSIMEKARNLLASAPNRFSFMYVTIPNLSHISEVYGHQTFDASMELIANLFGDTLAPYPVGRISEHEFLVLIPNRLECEQATGSAAKMIEALLEKQTVENVELDLKCDIAFVSPGITHEPLDILIQAAIHSIATDKANRREVNVITIDSDMFDSAKTAIAIKRDLSGAIANGDIYSVYQPIVDTGSGEINGFEALARWQHQQFGFISPGVFIPLAEQSHLIIALGESILEQACQFIESVNKLRSENGQTMLTMHVNLSASHFYHTELPKYLAMLIDKYQLQPGQLVIEVTESMLMGDEAEVTSRMEQMKSLGLLFALDDFGTGYSSFSTLCSFPLDIVKLDKSYIDQIESNDRAKSLVRNIANMAQELGLTTVAEGVETASQARKLKSWNIEEIQGYYFYKPMPSNQVLKLLNAPRS